MYAKIILFLIIFQNSESVLHKFNLSEPAKVFKLEKTLNEISGIIISDEEEIFCHEDENVIIYKLNKTNCKIIDKYIVGNYIKKDDIEDIEIVGNYFYLVNSSGFIYKIDKKNISKYEIIKTKLSSKNDVEGICYNSKRNSLVLICKGDSGIKDSSVKTAYEYNLKTNKFDENPILKINIKEVLELSKRKDFTPSAIRYIKEKDSYLILDSKGLSLIEINSDNKIINFKILDKSNHRQPEGLSLDLQGNLIIADEADRKKAKISVYEKK